MQDELARQLKIITTGTDELLPQGEVAEQAAAEPGAEQAPEGQVRR